MRKQKWLVYWSWRSEDGSFELDADNFDCAVVEAKRSLPRPYYDIDALIRKDIADLLIPKDPKILELVEEKPEPIPA